MTTARAEENFRRSPLILYAVLLGMIAGVLCLASGTARSRLDQFNSISLGMSETEAVQKVEDPHLSGTGCGTPSWRPNQCRFEDPWREYVIIFNPETHLVVGKRFSFKGRFVGQLEMDFP